MPAVLSARRPRACCRDASQRASQEFPLIMATIMIMIVMKMLRVMVMTLTQTMMMMMLGMGGVILPMSTTAKVTRRRGTMT
eukprot:4585179-Pyramimonas_sp.AAC.1